MKVLLLTDIPPCHNYTAGLVTAQMCRAFTPGEIAAFIIMNGELKPQQEPDLAWIPTAFVAKPNERGQTRVWSRDLGEFAAFAHESRTRLSRTGGLVEAAVRFGLDQQVDQVWAILQGQTMVRVSRRVARALGVPLKTQIWDPLSWWHRAWGVDRFNRMLDNRELAKTLRESTVVASASPAMSREISEKYGVESFPIIASVDRTVSHEPSGNFRTEDEIVIGMAGQFYAMDGWLAFCHALTVCGWRIGGRRVVLSVLGGSPPPNSIPPEHVRYHGWLEQTDAIALLARECDVLYCPYPFSAEMAEVSRLSFPSKIVIYLAAGRPIFFHGPDYSSPYRYLSESEAGLLCGSLGSDAILETLLRLIEEPDLYPRLTQAGRRAFLRDFTTERQRQLVRQFVDRPHRRNAQAVRLARSRSARRIVRHAARATVDPLVEKTFDYWRYLGEVPLSQHPINLLLHYVEIGWRELRDPNDWFSTRFYLHNNPDVAEAQVEPLGHYLSIGWRQGRDPNPWFSTRFYLERNPHVASSGIEPMEHYRHQGWREGRDPSSRFSVAWYLLKNPDVAAAGAEPFSWHFRQGWREGRNPAEWFWTNHYLGSNPDVAASGMEPYTHYTMFGHREDRDPNGWFSTRHYREHNGDVVEAGIEPLEHYLKFGWREGRDPMPWFSTSYYLEHNPELREAGTEPCWHYFQSGWRKGQSPSPWFSVPFYLGTNPDVAAANVEPLAHYLSEGWQQGRDPNDWFSVSYYLSRNPDVLASAMEPMQHYLLVGKEQGRTTHPGADEAREDINARHMALAERLTSSIALEIEAEIKASRFLGRSESGSYFDLMHAATRVVHNWLVSTLD